MTAPQIKYRKDYTPTDFLIHETHLAFDLHADSTHVKSKLVCARRPGSNLKAPLILEGAEEIELLSIKQAETNTDLPYRLENGQLVIENLPMEFTLLIENRIQPHLNTRLSGLYLSKDVYCTQCEAEGFRHITYYLDRPDVLSIFTTQITADKTLYPVLLSNGNLVEAREVGEGRHTTLWHDPYKKPCYLFALVAGNLKLLEDTFITRSGRSVALKIYVRDHLDQCQHAMDSLKLSMEWDEKTFDREYDLDVFHIVAVDDFNMGAMENKSLNIFNTKYILAKRETATDTDFQNILGVVGHEYFHNWTGNRITCRDWFQLSLKEGLTVYRDQEFTSDYYSRPIKRIQEVSIITSAQFSEDASPMAHPIRPDSYIEMNNFYTVTVYNKGAEVIRMQETLLGKAGFKRGMDLYFSRHDGEAVTCDDFVNAMSDANGVDLEQFRLWYSQDGTPIVSAEDHYNPDTQTYTLTLHQECPDSATQKNKKPFHIPVKVGLLDQNGQELNAELLGKHATTHVLELRKPSETFTFHSVKTKPIPSLLRDFSAPVKLNYPYTEAQLLFLFSHDSNEFNRWNAGQQLFTRKILEQVECILEKQPLTLPSQYVQAISKILESDCDTALIAEAVMLPSEQALSETMRIIHVDALHQARLFNVNTLATELKNHWLNIYQTHDEAVFSVTPSSIAKRRFKNVALSYLARLDTPEVIQLIDQQFKTAHNMTDQLSALGLLLNCSNAPIRESALLEFYTRFKDDALVMDKWLALQALADRPDTPERVAQLLSHPTFNIKNPNKVYALLGSFTRNAAHFHRADGAGYELIYSAIETLNPINPQVTARLVRSFMNFKRYEPALSQKMRQILERLMQKSLCKDAYEIVTKALG